MNEFTWDKLEPTGPTTFGGQFKFKGNPVGQKFTVNLSVICRGTPFWEFWSSCDDPIVSPACGGDTYEDQGNVTSDYYIVKVAEKSRVEDDDCIILTFEWNVWKGTSLTPGGGPPIVTADGKLSTVIGDVTGQITATTTSYMSGQFVVRVCCTKGDDGCASQVTLLSQAP